MTVTNLILEIYKDLGFEDVILKYSDRPELRVGDDQVWDKSEAALLEAIKATKLEYSINKGEGAFYDPKIEFSSQDGDIIIEGKKMKLNNFKSKYRLFIAYHINGVRLIDNF